MPFSSVLGASSVIKPGVCTSTTRPTVPYEGQLIYETDTDMVAAYNGSAWVYTATSGLVLIKTQTIGNAVSSVTVSDAFSSTYDNYRITVYGGAGSGALNIGLTLGATATGYYRWGTYSLYSATTVLGLSGNNAASWSDVVSTSTNSIHGQIELYGPNVAKNTHMNAITPQSVTSSGPVLQAGYLNDNTQYTAFTLTVITPGGTMTGGTIRVYGYRN